MKNPQEYTQCPKCGKPGIEKSDESLPDKGILIKVMHDDGSICDFVEYPSISSFFLDRTKRKRNPKNIVCPACGKEGRISNYRPNKAKQFHSWKYLVVHEPTGGYWGKDHKVRRYRRCYMKTENQRMEILKILGRNKGE
jgi:predicted RNA-binding Zn-ribbon protein involved in translation (DUF1610 family)